MKKVLFLVLAVIFLWACEKTPEEIAVTSVSLSQSTAKMIEGETLQLQVSISPSSAMDKSVIWGSSKQSVATVSNNGLVSAVSEGSSTITATVGDKSATCSIVVNKRGVEVSSIELNKTELFLAEGESETLIATIKPDNATNKTIIWSTSDSSVAKVEDGKVSAVKEGEVFIIAKAGEQEAKCKVFVTKSYRIEAIDLGLSVKWADVNLGATSPEEFGDYYAWGEKDPYYEDGYAQAKNAVWKPGKENGYCWASYQWYDSPSLSCTKYNQTDNIAVLDLQDDAAHAKLGDEWRIPTWSETKELVNECTWVWTTRNGVYGYEITSNKEGYKDKSIFIPAAGSRLDVEYGNPKTYYGEAIGYLYFGKYWTSSTYDGYYDSAIAKTINNDSDSDIKSFSISSRFYGMTIRPVFGNLISVSKISLDKTEVVLQEHEKCELSLSVFPENASDVSIINWSSNNPSIVTVSHNNELHCTIEGKAKGSAVITATMRTAKGLVSACCTVNVTFTASAPVDLGLSVKWADANLGALAPEEYGYYYAWGEIEPKNSYYWDTYKWCNGDSRKLTKYCQDNKSNYWNGTGSPDNNLELELSDDAAHTKLGGAWRIPTKLEWNELRENCTWTWTNNYNGTGIAGQIITSNKAGYTDKSIFLPAAGCQSITNNSSIGIEGYYWSTTLSSERPSAALIEFFGDSDEFIALFDRCFGCSIRPVTE